MMDEKEKSEADRVRAMIKRRVDEMRAESGITYAWISKECGKGAQYLSEYFARGRPDFLPEDFRHRFAQITGLDENALRSPRSRVTVPAGSPTWPARGAAPVAKGDAEFIDPAKASEDIKKFASAFPRAEIWRVLTNAIEGKAYLPGDYVVVDLARHPRVDDFVLVVHRRDDGSAEPLLRRYLPPYVIQYSPNLPSDPLYVDDTRVMIKGVIAFSGRATPR
jgi:hypothetical protein